MICPLPQVPAATSNIEVTADLMALSDSVASALNGPGNTIPAPATPAPESRRLTTPTTSLTTGSTGQGYLHQFYATSAAHVQTHLTSPASTSLAATLCDSPPCTVAKVPVLPFVLDDGDFKFCGPYGTSCYFADLFQLQ